MHSTGISFSAEGRALNEMVAQLERLGERLFSAASEFENSLLCRPATESKKTDPPICLSVCLPIQPRAGWIHATLLESAYKLAH